MAVTQVSQLDNMGSDLTIANAARVSFDKHKEKFDLNDERLIKFLARSGHWSPFAHVSQQLKIDAPIFIARQLQKHQVGLAWNEVSRRYVSTPPEFYTIDVWRKQSKDKKQGSSSEPIASQSIAHAIKKEAEIACVNAYNALLRKDVCLEQARTVLPLSLMTSWYWSGSLAAFSRVCNLRLKPDTQYETREVAKSISNHCATMFPISWKTLIEG
tara:strand:+ start:26 stop:667 length:642 start_codon:yes stop_codon:yes gene_type:complete